MVLLLHRVVIVAARVHRMLLDLCKLSIRVLKNRFNTAIVDEVLLLILDVSFEVHSSHILLPDLIGRQVLVCIVPRSLLIGIDLLDSIETKVVEIIWILCAVDVAIQSPQDFLIFLIALIRATTHIVFICSPASTL